MKRAIFILPYFGTLPNYFPLWLASCVRNPGYDWMLISDQQITVPVPENVHVKNISFEKFAEQVQSHFDFPICLHRAQKLCDFKVAYGMIFQEEIRDYRYWGFCDMDLIWGNLDHFLAEPIACGYEKILELGHCTLMLNNEKMRNFFKTKVPGCLYYKDVFSTDQGKTFDEDAWPPDAPLKGMATMVRLCNINVWRMPECFADVQIGTYSIRKLNDNGKQSKHYAIYIAEKGRVFYCYENADGVIEQEEQAYMHMQKRKWLILSSPLLSSPLLSSQRTDNAELFCILPPGKIVDFIPDWRNRLHSLAPEGFAAKWYDLQSYLRKRSKYWWHHFTKLFQIYKKISGKENKNEN